MLIVYMFVFYYGNNDTKFTISKIEIIKIGCVIFI